MGWSKEDTGHAVVRAAIGFRSFVRSCINLIYPARCYNCDALLEEEEGDFFCARCTSRAKLIHSPLCSRCGVPFAAMGGEDHLCGTCLTWKPYFSKARAIGYYEGVLQRAIHAFKYQNRPALGEFLGTWMGMLGVHLFTGNTYHLLMPVPLHPRRLRERGYNQALHLCKWVHKIHQIPVDYSSLVRIRETIPQVGLDREARRRNIRGAFALKSSRLLEGRSILLIDDVYTSGATANECAKVLIRGGARHVDALTLARAV